MITEKRKTGNIGEEYAADYLKNNGYDVVLRNYSTRAGEVDIIAENLKYIVFAEVKTRAEDGMGEPAEAVTKGKQQRIIRAATQYLEERPSLLQPRFDVIEVKTDINGKPVTLNHLENAFWAGRWNG